MRKLSELIQNLYIEKIIGETDREISSIQYDSRKCEKDSLFVAISGNHVDGHDFIQKAIENGATVIVCERIDDSQENSSGITFLSFKNSRVALAHLSHNFYGNPTKDLNVIGATGTNGKTTITFLIKSIFEAAGEKVGIIGTTGIFIGNEKVPATHTTPESLELCSVFNEMRQKGVTTVAIEVSSHSLDQHRVEGIHFKAALFTNLTHDHLDYHLNYENYANAKKMLFDMLPEDSIAIVNSDDDYGKFMLQDCISRNKHTIGRNTPADFIIENEILGIEASEFTLKSNSFNLALPIKTKLLGRFNIDNAGICAALAYSMGIDISAICEGLLKSDGAPGRMHRILLKNGAVAIVDYAHTPDALEKALNSCRDIIISSGSTESKLICVFGCGGDRDNAKRAVMGRIASSIADYAIITSDNPRTEEPDKIIEEIYSGIDEALKNKAVRITNRHEAIKYAVGISNSMDLVLVAGKGHEDYQVIGKEKFHFSDIEELEKFTGD